MFPTDAKLMHRARERLVRLAKKRGVRAAPVLCAGRQVRADQAPALRPCQAVQARRARRCASLRPISAASSATSRARSPATTELRRRFARPLHLARRVLEQNRHQRGRKVYQPARARGRMHRQGQGAQTLRVRRQGQRRHHAQALEGRPVRRPCQGAARQPLRRPHARQGHPAIEALVGNDLERILADAGYRATTRRPTTSSRSTPRPEAPHDAADQARDATTCRRRAGHRPSQGRAPHGPQLSRPPHGDAINAVLAAAGYNFRLLLKWLTLLLLKILSILARPLKLQLA